jgi:hypothetical protein
MPLTAEQLAAAEAAAAAEVAAKRKARAEKLIPVALDPSYADAFRGPDKERLAALGSGSPDAVTQEDMAWIARALYKAERPDAH